MSKNMAPTMVSGPAGILPPSKPTDFDAQSLAGQLPRTVSHAEIERMAEGFGYNQGYRARPYGEGSK
jgi:hypothetical protein